MIREGKENITFETGAVRSSLDADGNLKGRMDLVPWEAIMELSKHCQEGAEKYGPHNVRKGLPWSSLIDSSFRHLAKFTEGWTDEDHARAALWNIAWLVQETITHPELDDRWKKGMEE